MLCCRSAVVDLMMSYICMQDNNLSASDFIAALKRELDSTGGQPSLLPFLQSTLPGLREFMRTGHVTIEGIRPPAAILSSSAPFTTTTTTAAASLASIGSAGSSTALSPATSSPASSVTASRAPTPATSAAARGPLREVDELNDVAAMGGVNLSEETRQLATVAGSGAAAQRAPCSDRLLLNAGALRSRLADRARTAGLQDCAEEAVALCSHSAEALLRDVLEQLVVAAENRLRPLRLRTLAACRSARAAAASAGQPCQGSFAEQLVDQLMETNDFKTELRFLEELDRLEHAERQDCEEWDSIIQAAEVCINL